MAGSERRVMNATESFEDVYKRLEEAVRRLEEGGLTLDQSIVLYEEGMGLAKTCQTLLEKAELRITYVQTLLAEAVDEDEEEHEDDL